MVPYSFIPIVLYSLNYVLRLKNDHCLQNTNGGYFLREKKYPPDRNMQNQRAGSSAWSLEHCTFILRRDAVVAGSKGENTA